MSQKNKLYLLKSEARKLRIYYQSKYGELCVSSHQTEWEKLKKTLSLVEFGTIQMCTDNYIDKSCRINKAYDYLEDTVREMFSPPSEGGKNSFLSCLENDESKKLFEKRLGAKEGHERFIFTIVNFKNRILKFLNSVEEGAPSTISCKESYDPNERPKSIENGQIQILIKSDTLKAFRRRSSTGFAK